MTRINTNVPSIVAQQTLQRSNTQLNEVLTRLSTGLRINTGKDDPAGLIASEVLRSDIISVERAITNSERANQLISTADSALGQVSSLLNDIRGLVSEAANTGALSEEQIAANQLQVDSSLEAIDRIAQTTVFQGRRLLDGSLDFLTTDTGASASGTVDGGTITGATASSDLQAVYTLTAGANGAEIQITAATTGTSANGYTFTFASGGSAGDVVINGKDVTIDVALSAGAADADTILAALTGDATFSTLFDASLVLTTTGASGSDTLVAASASTAQLGEFSNEITISAAAAGTDFNATTFAFDLTSGGTLGATYDESANAVSVTLNSATTAADVASAINALTAFNAAATGSGLGTYAGGGSSDLAISALAGGTDGSSDISNLVIEQANFGTASQIAVQVDVDTQATQAQLNYSGGTLVSDLILEIGGASGFEVFNFGTGTTIDQIETAIDLVSDSTGVDASVSGGTLELTSANYGSNEFVSARALSGTFDTLNTSNAASTRESGTDVDLRINGVKATGDGLTATINSSTLDLSFNIASTVSDGATLGFNITGGGATFQLGPDVVSNQQARVGIRGISSATLGGVEGTLFELRSGSAKALSTDATGAGKVVEEVITAVTSLRGRLGAFQKATLETNIFSLTEQLENLTEAESSIRDADFAAESARLTRAQILVQSGTSVLSIANQNPQNVLSLLR